MRHTGLLGIKYDEKSSFLKGCRLAPPEIRNALWSDSSNLYAETGQSIEESFSDVGDLSPRRYEDIEGMVLDKLESFSHWIILGGDHSVTYPIIKALNKKSPSFEILHIDAHSDTYHEFQGDPYSHACPFARIMEEGLCKRLIQVGIRTLNDHQRNQIEQWPVQCIEMMDLSPLRDLRFEYPVYVSLDLDGFDPGFAPGVSHYEPGGLSPRQVINLIHRINVPILGADIVEYNPSRDIHGITASLAAKLLKELVGQINRLGH
jgi:agmatinase